MRFALHLLLTGIFLLGFAPSSTAQSLLGGETVKRGEHAVSVQLGYPELRAGYHIPVIDQFEIAPRFTYFYAGLGNRISDTLNPPQVGLAFAADFKWNFYSSARFHVAAIWRVGVNLEFIDGVDAAIQIGLPGGIAMNYEMLEKVDLLFGFDSSSAVVVTGEPAIYAIPFVFHLGAAIDLSRHMALTLVFEGGPSIAPDRADGQSGSTVGGWVGGFAGLEFYL